MNVTQYNLIPVRRDNQIASVIIGAGGGSSSMGSSSSVGGGSGTAIAYTGGTGINVSGTTISVVFGTTSTTVACGSHLHTGVYLPVNNPVATGTFKAPIISGGTCITTPILLASTCVCSPLLCTTNLTLACDASSVSFTSGYAGSGWKLDNTGSSYDLEVDNLRVRNNLSAYQLEINEVNAVNGSLVISSANGIAYCLNATCIYFDTDGGANPISFAAGDIIKAQVYTGAGTASYLGRVIAVNQCNTLGCAYITTTTLSGTPFDKMKLVQVGNCATAGRQNLIYITASDSCNPYIDMLAGVTDGNFAGKQKVRIGNLAGITDACFGGALSGYGLYADNIYLKGQIVITAGSVPNTVVTGLGSLATASSVDLNTQVTNKSLANLDSTANTKLGGIQAGADVTASHTAANITGQGSLATANAADFSTQVCGATKPANNATVGAVWGTNLTGIPAPLGTPSGSGLFLGSCYMGYYSGGQWQSYIDCAGNSKFVGVTEFGTQTACIPHGGVCQNVAIKGADIWENSGNNYSALHLNRVGYQGGTTTYRDLVVYDGMCHEVIFFSNYNNTVYFGNNSDPKTICLCSNGAMTAPDFIMSSDCRMKTNIEPIKILPVNIQYKQFEFCNEPNKIHYGVVAQDLQNKYPELVTENADGMLSVSYISLFAREIASLKCQIKDLKEDINYYRNYNS